MFNTRTLQDEILRLKKEKDFCILAHSYQSHEIVEIAEFVGDSFGLSVNAQGVKEKNILMCGVRFMAETAKILSPDKHVFLSHKDASCPMAEQLQTEELKKLKEEYPDYTVVAYINTTAKLKMLCDVCVTSSSAVKIVKNIPNDKILFIPDCNLGSWVQKQVPNKQFKFIKGGCPIHVAITKEAVLKAKKEHPDALVLVHPECVEEVASMADYVGSTTGIIEYVLSSDKEEFIIGTENNIASHLRFELPDKRIYTLSKECVCKNMKLTTLNDIYDTLTGKTREEIVLDDDVYEGAKRSIDMMIELGK